MTANVAASGPTDESAPARPGLSTVILRNTVWATIGLGLVKLTSFLFLIVTARILGESGLGKYFTVVAFVDLFSVLFELGMTQYVQREVARDRSRAAGLFWNLVALRFLLAVASCGLIVGLATLAGYEPVVIVGMLLFTATFVLSALLSPLDTMLTANERFDLSTLVGSVGQLLSMALSIVFLLLGHGFLALLYTGLIVMPIQIALCFWLIRRYQVLSLPVNITPSTWKSIILAGLPFGLTAVALTYNFKADTVILGFFHDSSVVGWYNVAYRFVFSIIGLLGGFLVAMRPSLAREYLASPQQSAAWVRASIQWLTLFGLPVAVGGTLLAHPIILTLYGASYEPAGVALAILIWDVPLLLLAAFFGNVTAALGLERPAFKVYLVCTGLNVAINVLLIPQYGMYAASAATLISDGSALALFFILLHKRIELGQVWPILGRVALAAGLMGVVVWLARPLGWPVAMAGGMVSFGLLVTVMRLVDWSSLIAPIRRRITLFG